MLQKSESTGPQNSDSVLQASSLIAELPQQTHSAAPVGPGVNQWLDRYSYDERLPAQEFQHS
jgi:hypothetical protein